MTHLGPIKAIILPGRNEPLMECRMVSLSSSLFLPPLPWSGTSYVRSAKPTDTPSTGACCCCPFLAKEGDPSSSLSIRSTP